MNLPRAAQPIAFGQEITDEHVVPTNYRSSAPVDDPRTEEWTPVGKVALVNITEGEILQPSMVSPTLGEALIPPGKTVVSVLIANPQILEFAPVGGFLDLYSVQTEHSERLVRSGQILRITREAPLLEADTTPNAPLASNTYALTSATVLLAVSEAEAHKLAQFPSWEGAFTAVLVH